MELYRFRPTNRLIADRELEDHYFFFAAPSQLNDPLEGFVDLYWQGDAVAWLGLFSHCAFQFFIVCKDFFLAKPIDEILEKSFSLHHRAFRNLPIYNVWKKFAQKVYDENSLQDIATRLSKKKVSESSLRFILGSIHGIFMRLVLDEILAMKFDNNAFVKAFEVISKNKNIYLSEDFIAIISDQYQLDDMGYKHCRMENTLKLKGEYIIKKLNIKNNNMLFLCDYYPNVYVDKISRLIYPADCCVCFNADFSNPSMWGHYADDHKGACLIFNRELGPRNILQVKYGERPPQRNFFASLGLLTGPEQNDWFVSAHGDTSVAKVELAQNIDSWRNQYWTDNQARLSRKGSAWIAENEYRIILNEESEISPNSSARKQTYDFKFLCGIIFGIRTPLDQKIMILEILKKKCEENCINKFNIYQAKYDQSFDRIERDLLMTLPIGK